jgi:hypothetical protein
LVVFLREYGAEKGASGTQHVHGMCRSGNTFQHRLHLDRQTSKALQFPDIVLQFRLGRQITVDEEMSDFFKGGLLCEFNDIIAPVMQIVSRTSNGTDCGVACNHT